MKFVCMVKKANGDFDELRRCHREANTSKATVRSSVQEREIEDVARIYKRLQALEVSSVARGLPVYETCIT